MPLQYHSRLENKASTVTAHGIIALPKNIAPIDTHLTVLEQMSKTNRREFLINAAPVAAASLLLPALAAPNSHATFADGTQRDWRYCDKCFNLFYDGYPDKGHCSAGAGHRAQGLNFVLLYGNLTDTKYGQINWRYCDKCHVMFYDGYSGKGRCAAGGAHHAQGYNFRLSHDGAPYADEQTNWRYCSKCFGMFYDGYPGKGSCPAGAGHVAQGYMFNLPHPPDPTINLVLAGLKASEVNFRQDIVTPSGTALRGYVELTMRSDGSYKAQVHMAATGFPNYKFLVHAAFFTSTGLVFALQQSGHVKGTESLASDKERKFDQDIVGSHPFIKDNWESVKAGHLAVSKEYSATGIAGFIQDVAKLALNIGAGAVKGAHGIVVGLGDAMKSAINTVEYSGTLGVIGGVVVFASGGTMALAVATGVDVGLMTKALVKARRLKPEEAGFAAQVFGGTLPPTEKIWLTNLEGLSGRAFTMPGPLPEGNIYLNVGAYCQVHPLTHQDPPYNSPGQLFIHEMTHAWQIFHKTFVAGWVCSGLLIQARNFVDNVYTVGAYDGRPWTKYNLEQQGTVVDQWYARQNVQPKPDPTTDPFFKYIRDNIRTGQS